VFSNNSNDKKAKIAARVHGVLVLSGCFKSIEDISHRMEIPNQITEDFGGMSKIVIDVSERMRLYS
jgi:hypothetical protein